MPGRVRLRLRGQALRRHLRLGHLAQLLLQHVLRQLRARQRDALAEPPHQPLRERALRCCRARRYGSSADPAADSGTDASANPSADAPPTDARPYRTLQVLVHGAGRLHQVPRELWRLQRLRRRLPAAPQSIHTAAPQITHTAAPQSTSAAEGPCSLAFIRELQQLVRRSCRLHGLPLQLQRLLQLSLGPDLGTSLRSIAVKLERGAPCVAPYLE